MFLRIVEVSAAVLFGTFVLGKLVFPLIGRLVRRLRILWKEKT